MNSTARGWLRLLARGAIWALIGILWVPTAICQLVTGAGLFLIEALKDVADRLR